MASLLEDRLEVSLALIAYATVLTALVSLPLGILAALRKDGLDRPDRAGDADGDDGDAGVLARHPVPDRLQPPARPLPGLRLRRGLARPSPPPLPAGADDRAQHRADPGPVAPGEHPRSDGLGLRADGAGEGVAGADGRSQPRLANALIPPVTLFGLSVGYLMGGTVIVENVFSLPGAGQLLVDAIGARDYPVVQSTTLVFAALVILVNLLTDLVYTFLDPRVRLG